MTENTEFFCTITLLISWITGNIAKKLPWFEDYLIPVQNMLIGISIAVTEWIFTKNFQMAIAVSGIAAGGIYDVLHNLNIILKKILKIHKDLVENEENIER